MENINIKKILNTYKMFSKRQREILEKLSKNKEIFTFDDLQKELQEDSEAKELLQKLRFIAHGDYEKAGIIKPAASSKPELSNGNIEEIELWM
ncbi:hypothetical protein [Clostridium sp. C2-6-12]|uniref:hypothetical protein n=1 Tax=Clostridium sp. C2-6-12 TaxID=2698832 RepID=UPI001371EDE0|nr:hypothetical protein [Clostridium sp. C2-6-12]